MSASPSDAGLQAERTGLAWSRTSLGVGANALLLAVREVTHEGSWPALVLAGAAAVLAVVVALYGRRRTVRLSRSPLPSPLAADRAVPVLGGAVAVLALVTGLVLVLR
ncbi:hypothetical protein Acsp06_48160 [Actinomycetospora sp. NBRC 106375]|uniref:DUF202 domain-containing protein n=1 Tax=Actinomycetospora sp. NBRC 106375 TaxID=3032207 RepID=UPI0024A227FF|nr:DUF202 domain-containing protein [Actinomycetospora sp. NBRC 106375]GLZ48631.1 hypothetical protein Acsp06_48160 [Actinomycetospora sp. NBRC 106375]